MWPSSSFFCWMCSLWELSVKMVHIRFAHEEMMRDISVTEYIIVKTVEFPNEIFCLLVLSFGILLLEKKRERKRRTKRKWWREKGNETFVKHRITFFLLLVNTSDVMTDHIRTNGMKIHNFTFCACFFMFSLALSLPLYNSNEMRHHLHSPIFPTLKNTHNTNTHQKPKREKKTN